MLWQQKKGRQSIGSRIFVGYGVIMALAMGFLLVVVALLIEANTREVDALDRRQRLETTALRLKLSLEEESDGVRGFLLGGEEDYLTPYREAILRHQAALFELDRLVITPADRQALQAVRDGYDTFLLHAENQIRLRSEGRREQNDEKVQRSITLWQTVGRASKESLQRAIDEFVGVHQRAITVEVTAADDRRSQVYLLTLLMLVLAGVSVILSGRRITHSITEPVGRLVEVASAFSQGDLGRRATIDTRDELATLAGVMHGMAGNLEHSRRALQESLDQTERRNRQLATLNDLAETLSGSLDLRLILGQALDHLLRLTELEAGLVWLLDGDDLAPEPLVTRRLAPEVLEGLHTARRRRWLLAAARRGAAVNRNEPIGRDVAAAEDDAAPWRAVAIVPLATRDQTLGVIAVGGPRPRRFSDDERDLYQAIGRQIAVGIENARLFAAEQRLTKEALGLADTARLVSGSLDLDEILPIIAQSGVWLLGVDRCVVFLFDTVHGRRPAIYHFGMTDEHVALIRQHADSLQRVARRYIEQTDSLVVPDAAAEARGDIRELLGRFGARSSLAIALQARGRPLGVLYFDTTHRPRDFAPHDQRVAVALADQASVAIENALLYAGVQERASQLAGMYEIGKVISATLEAENLYQVLYRETSRLMDADTFIIALNGENGAVQHLVFGMDGGRRYPAATTAAGAGLTGYVAGQGEPLLASRAELERLGVEPAPFAGAAGATQSILCAPMTREGWVIGVMSTQSYQPEAYTEQHLELFVAIANQAAIAVENSQLHRRALDLAIVEERNRLARELHDSVTQMLFSITLTLQAGRVLLQRNVARAEQQIEKAQQTAQEALAEMRALIYQLRPASMRERGLVGALASYLESFRVHSSLAVTFVHEGGAVLNDAQEQALFRIAQEALNNVLKHAQARSVEVRLTSSSRAIALTVKDDGPGLPAAPPPRAAPTWGITGMRERAEILGGTFAIESAPGSGTLVRVELPLTAAEMAVAPGRRGDE